MISVFGQLSGGEGPGGWEGVRDMISTVTEAAKLGHVAQAVLAGPLSGLLVSY
jgi:hypothetical protein